jgi:hypothetical protein
VDEGAAFLMEPAALQVVRCARHDIFIVRHYFLGFSDSFSFQQAAVHSGSSSSGHLISSSVPAATVHKLTHPQGNNQLGFEVHATAYVTSRF